VDITERKRRTVDITNQTASRTAKGATPSMTDAIHARLEPRMFSA